MAHDEVKRTVHTAEAELAYYAASIALSVRIDLDDLRDMAALTHTADDVKVTVEAMLTERTRPRAIRETKGVARRVIETALYTLKQRAQARRNTGNA